MWAPARPATAVAVGASGGTSTRRAAVVSSNRNDIPYGWKFAGLKLTDLLSTSRFFFFVFFFSLFFLGLPVLRGIKLLNEPCYESSLIAFIYLNFYSARFFFERSDPVSRI
jgi:hypothetical protein